MFKRSCESERKGDSLECHERHCQIVPCPMTVTTQQQQRIDSIQSEKYVPFLFIEFFEILNLLNVFFLHNKTCVNKKMTYLLLKIENKSCHDPYDTSYFPINAFPLPSAVKSLMN